VAGFNTDESQRPDAQVITFGPFELHRSRRILHEGSNPVRLGSRAFEILVALIERPGEVVTKQELVARAWPGMFVESSNLRVHIAALRKVLRDDQAASRYIRSVSGRGYSFVAPVSQISRAGPTGSSDFPLPLPPLLTKVIGRAEAIEAIAKQVKARRLVSIVGPGGIGKSTVALAAAEPLAALYANKLHFIDLSVIDDFKLTPTAVATAIGVSALAANPLKSVIAYLRNVRMLLVLDNCEHVIEGAAQLVEALLQGATGVDILVTSREPLLVQGESVYRLESLRAPHPLAELTAAEAQTYSAVELFLERATGKLEDYVLTDADARDVAGICSRLDGIPLAIELAAARVDLLGIRGLAAQLDGRLLLLSKGRRSAQPRHQSLRAMLDWSYETLPPREQTVLRRVSVFRGAFSARAAREVVADDTVDSNAVDDGIIVLAGKSLVTGEFSEDTVYYRLLQTTRTYGFEKLETDPIEYTATLRRHAEHLCSELAQAQVEWETMPRPQWVAQYGRLIDDVRAALEWAFGPGGDVALGAALTAASLPFGFQLAQIDEFMRLAERALRTLAGLTPAQPVAELRLTVALANLLWNTGASEARIRETLIRAASLAERIGIAKMQVEPLTSQAVFQLELGNYSGAVEACEILARAADASGDPLAILLAERASAQAHHFAGDHGRSRMLAERVLCHPARAIPLAYSQTSVDKNVSMRIILARILWLQGSPDTALEVTEESLRLAASDGPFAMCQALALAACPIALWRGDRSADLHIENLLQFSSRYTLHQWHSLGLYFQSIREVETTTESPNALELVDSSVGPTSIMHRDLLATLSERWIDEATIARAQSGASGWCAPEVLRMSAELELRRPGTQRGMLAEARLMESIQLARKQQALAWELRSVTSLAQLLRRNGRAADGRAHLGPVYQRFVEGHQTSDLRAAARLLAAL
jgi:predicted ATPase/DNA-binding winged helix-turn-helix (wHTH) protein